MLSLRLIAMGIAMSSRISLSDANAQSVPSETAQKLYGYLKAHKEKYKLADPETQLREEATDKDRGRILIRLYQVLDDVRIEGTLVSAWISPSGLVEIGCFETRDVTVKTTTPQLSREKAYAIAVNDLKPAGGVTPEESGTYLVIIPRGLRRRKTDTLAWTVAVNVDNDTESSTWSYTIDAIDGSIIERSKVSPLEVAPPKPEQAASTILLQQEC